ncbi:MAG: putative glycoside hydrolase, partial [bacterium]|nr:putative glycoside hydrolase [bacterium]
MSMAEMASAGITIVSHASYDLDLIEAAAKYGIKILPYLDLEKVTKSSGDAFILRNPFWRAVDADTNNHPEWFCIDNKGKIKRPFNSPGYHLGFEQACNNHLSLQQAQLCGVKDMLKLGAGGVFIDNAYPSYDCPGSKLGVHQHDWPDKNNRMAYREALQAVYKAVKAEGKTVFINTEVTPDIKGLCDASMVESFVYSSAQRPGSGNSLSRDTWRSAYPVWHNFQSDYASVTLAQRDHALAALSYFEDHCTADEAAFFSFAYIKLLGIKYWGANAPMWYGDYPDYLQRRDIFRRLYRAHDLGKALSKPVINGDWGYRLYEKAYVVVNASDKTLSVDVPVGKIGKVATELFSGEFVTVNKDGSAKLVMPPQTGRVIMSREEVYKNFLREVKGQSEAAGKYLANELQVNNSECINPAALDGLTKLSRQADYLLSLLEAGKPLPVQQINALTRVADRLKSEDFIRETARKITATPQLKTAEVADLVKLNNDRPLVEKFNGGADGSAIKIRIKSAKASYLLFHRDYRTFMVMGEDSRFSPATGPICRAGSSAEDFMSWRIRKNARILIGATPGMQVRDSYVI